MASGTHNRDIVVIGASAGGVRALRTLLAALPADLPAAIFAVVHVSPDAPGVLASLLNRAGPLPVVRARHGDPIRRSQVVVAPPDHHLILEPESVRLSHGPRENRHRPSIDVLFRSAAVAYGPRVIGVVLTGMLDDGTAGLWAVKRYGGLAAVQDPADAECPDMPRNAMQVTRADACLPLAGLAARLVEWTRQPAAEIAAPSSSSALSREVRMAYEDSDMQQLDAIGKRVPLTCPECGGALWEIDDIGVPRYRCHVGHAYSMLTLASDQSARIEAAIWAALRSLEEGVRIADHMARMASERGDVKAVEYHEDRSLASARHAQVLRDLLAEATHSAASRESEPSSAG